ncbi:MAG: cysteine synthase A [bacterium]|nr:cysteine synthase A [bacterium]
MRNRIYDNITQLVGDTPLLRLNQLNQTSANILAKLESFNPMSSVKDRIGVAMIASAVEQGKLQPGGHIIEATSGNTGIGLAFAGSAQGFKVTLVMPESMSLERRQVLRALGAKLVLTEAAGGMKKAVEVANEMHSSDPGSFVPSQFDNPANPAAHSQNTAREIWNDTGGKVDVLVAGVGTGGTLTGCGRELRKKNPDLRIVAVEPKDSAVIGGGDAGPHKIMGIGAGFIPENLATDLIDEVVQVENEEAMQWARQAAAEEGLFVGISSGAALAAAMKVGAEPAWKDKNIVVVLPDFGERYLSTDLFNHLKD